VQHTISTKQLSSKTAPNQVGMLGLVVVALPLAGKALRRLLGRADDQSLAGFWVLFTRFRDFDFVSFMRNHREAYKKGQETGNYLPGVCNYYTLMSDVITATSGPFWHFVPMFRNLSRIENHHKYHQTLTQYLEAKQSDKVLEIGCGFGEMGRQVATISGASVTGLTMADAEIVGGNQRIRSAGLQDRCNMVQGNYHKLPFEANSFDKVFGIYTLKYSADPSQAIAEAARVLKPGGKFLSYEILVTDKYDPSDQMQRYYVDNISSSTCMPPLWHAKDFRDAATKAGLVATKEDDLCCRAAEVDQWYSCFTNNGIHQVLSSKLVLRLVGLGEFLRILPASFTDWYEHCAVHPTTDFVNAGRLGIVSGAVMMTWTKPLK